MIKSKVEEIYLHSHLHNYPLHHIDGKVSSQGQQVTGYPVDKDPNNWWIIRPANASNYLLSKTGVKNGDLVILEHLESKKCLLTHDVASALTRTNQEVTVWDCNEEERKNEMLWKIEIQTGMKNLKSKSCVFKLVHVATHVTLLNYQQNLPEWGFNQREINAARNEVDENTKWFIDSVESPFESEESNSNADEIRRLNFFEKFVELQKTSIEANNRLTEKHPAASHPITWPFSIRGINFWDGPKNEGTFSKIYLLGNIVAWSVATSSVFLFVALVLVDHVSQRRNVKLFNEESRKVLYKKAGFFFAGWAIHYFPFFLMGRVLYLHHYLPAFIFSSMLAASLIEFSGFYMKKSHLAVFIGIFVQVQVYIFWYFSSLTYGFEMPIDEMRAKQWLSTWDFI